MAPTTVQLSEDLQPQITEVVNRLGFKNQEEFIEEAVRDKILEIKKYIKERNFKKFGFQTGDHYRCGLYGRFAGPRLEKTRLGRRSRRGQPPPGDAG